MICDRGRASGTEALAHLGWRLGRLRVMVQAAAGQRLSFDPLPLEQDRLPATEVDVGRSKIAQALVGTGVVVVLDKGTDLRLERARQVVVLKQDAVLERLVPALDLALRLRMAGSSPDVRHAPAFQPRGQIACDVARSVVGEQ